MLRIERNMADKESETDRWISHFRSMAGIIGDNEQKKFYVLKQKSNPALLSTRVNTTKFNFITPSEAVVDQAVAEINRWREEPMQYEQEEQTHPNHF